MLLTATIIENIYIRFFFKKTKNDFRKMKSNKINESNKLIKETFIITIKRISFSVRVFDRENNLKMGRNKEKKTSEEDIFK